MIVATAGTTGAGVVDPIPTIADVAFHENIWFHVDAAWGGAAALVPELKHVLEGIERSDSITFDAHKWLSVPMGAGLYLTRHRDVLDQTFCITTDYIPRGPSELEVVEPYAQSIQCSRRFIGLKLFLPLIVAGWDGYATVIRHQTTMGDLLRGKLEASDWEIVNDTRLPVVCFRDRQGPEGGSVEFIEAVAREVVSSGEAWISTTRLYGDIPVVRACITSYLTEPEDLDSLMASLDSARQRFYRRRNLAPLSLS
jgi:glutamate/tyrosine decarboxylase-like PLP-dependent enzyme